MYYLIKHFLLIAFLIFYLQNVVGQNVGIGTAIPDEKLTVAGTIKAELNSSLSTPQLLIHEQDPEFGRISFTNNSSPQFFTLAGNPQRDSTLARFNIFNSDFGNIGTFTGHGRFGINAGNPVATLHLNSQPETDLLRVQNDGSTKFRIFSNDAMVFGSNWGSPIADVIRMETPNLFIGFDGNHVPTDRLEVDGDVNITGTIKANTVSGSPGQILTTGSDGNIAWSDPCGYNRFLGYPIPGTYPWTVPDGVTEVMVELWGAGGGGAVSGGGGAGAYVKASFTVASGQIVTIVTGAGGSGVTGNLDQNGGDGGTSSISGSNISAAALGGKGGTTTQPGAGGAFSITQPYLSATALQGESGAGNVTIPIYSGVDKSILGRGGKSPNASDSYGTGDVVITQGTTRTYNPGTSGRQPGGGGGGGDLFGNDGGDGYVIIRWKQ